MRNDEHWWLEPDFLTDVSKIIIGVATACLLLLECMPRTNRLAEGMTKYLEARTASILAADVCKAKEVKR